MKIFPSSLSNKAAFYHLLGWSVFILYEVTLVRIVRSASGLSDPILTGYVIPYVINISLFYFHALYVMNLCFVAGRKKPLLLLFLVAAELLAYLLLMGLVDGNPMQKSSGYLFDLYPAKVVFVKQLWRGIYFLLFGSAYWLITRSLKKERMYKEAEKQALIRQREKQQLELKLIASQNAYLQSQISPHLLFNTLNFIHSEVQEVSEKASDAVITLSDMMRYSLTQTGEDGKVELEQEVEQIENLVRINQFRFENKLCIDQHIACEESGARITPLLLVPFVENLFKYADLTDRSSPVLIRIGLRDRVLRFETKNKKKRTAQFSSSGIGIKNVETRLNSHYRDRFDLNISESETDFSVKLNVAL